jgi:uncharacterized protein YqeY
MQDKIRAELTGAMKAKDTIRLSVLRGLIAGFTNEAVAKGRKPDEKLSDEEALSVIRRGVKQRKDSIEQFKKGNREDLASKEEVELKILEAYLPAMMNKDDILKKALELKEKLGTNDKSKMGLFMAALMKELKGQADGANVKEVVDSLFA